VSTGGNSGLCDQDLIDHCKPVLGFKTPKHWTVVDKLPRNPNGKIDKTLLAQTHPQGSD